MYSKIKYAKYLSVMALVALALVGSMSTIATASNGSSCQLSKIRISAGTLTSKTETILLTATPTCWSGQVSVNRGNVDFHLITVTVTNGHGTGMIIRTSVAQNIHPYANNPGLRGNNIIVPAA